MPIASRRFFRSESDRSRDNKRSVLHVRIGQAHGKGWEPLERFRLRKMLVPKRCESVVGRNKQILPGYVCQMVERRPMRFHCRSKIVPNKLRGVGNRAPGCQCPTVDIQMFKLSGSTAIRGMRALPGEALAVPVIPSSIACGTVGITDEYGRTELGHSLSLQVLGWEEAKSNLVSTTKIPKISDLFKNKSTSSGVSRCFLW